MTKSDRPIDLVRAEIADACQEFADTLREQAANIIYKAEDLERHSARIRSTGDINVPKEENLLGARNQQDLALLQMKEAEIIQKIRRLQAEFDIKKERGEE